MDIVGLVGVDEAELLEVDPLPVVVVYYIIDRVEIFQGQVDAAKFAARHKLLETQRPVEVQVKRSEGLAVVFELLLQSDMDLAEHLLDVGEVSLRALRISPPKLVLWPVPRQLDSILKIGGIISPHLCEDGATIVDLYDALQLVEAQQRAHGAGVVVVAQAEVPHE
eukprot:CAMPEP_0170499812 /NCGR_PEP_ID=MMETSP0208-20121228/32683_1 /TAXON_ID=197538 /ORGANISM="Strombidium inclinatum, Strain S3" /LENGTH=165 /DNA_ID=CAMNT_0010777545 /DNA_START=489 /DNA_END=986 /DNA_ORIENTATION=+